MYTECPECGTAFRVTAKVLQQARGNVRCGGCSHAFNALEFLSEVMPGSPVSDEQEAPVDELAETSRRLLETLDDLAGPDEVHIEDTGVEWRVLEDIESGIDVEESGDADEPRYDDNSPLPDEFEEDDAPVILADDLDQHGEDATDATPPQRRLTDTHFSVEFNEMQSDLALTEPEDWDDVLDEVQDAESGSLEVEEELASIHTELASGRHPVVTRADAESDAEPDAEGSEPADIDTQFNLQAEALGLDRVGSEDALTDEVPLLPEDRVPGEHSADVGAAADNVHTHSSGDISDADPNELSDHQLATALEAAADREATADEARFDTSSDDSQAGIKDALSEEFDADAETGISEALSAEPDDESEAGINATLARAFDDDFESGINEALSDDFDENSATGINATLAEELDDDVESGSNEAHESSSSPAGSIAEIDHASDPQHEDEAGDDSAEVSENKSLADMIRESTGEFEAQIEAAASALAGDDSADDRDPSAFDTDDISSALDVAESERISDVDEAGDSDSDEAQDIQPAAADDESIDSGHFLPPQSDEELTVNREIDQELMALATQDDEFSATLVGANSEDFPFNENSGEVEAIIMEGEEVRRDVDEDRLAAESAARNQLDSPIDLADTFAASREKLFGGRRKYDPPGYAAIAATIVLVVALGAQFMHNSREILATTGFFNQTIGPVYRMLGDPITPAWNIKGWQFEVTNGSIEEAESALVIVSRLVNRDASPLPYPLVHVSLTDRWEDVMGSRILEPGEYLAGAVDPGQPVRPGESFTAVITIENPAEEATGFKLNVCYREGPETVRCAIEDFKN